MALYYGWILAFPYFGQVLKSLAQGVGFDYDSLTYSFLLSHALGFIIGAIFLIATWENLYWLSQNSDEWDKHYIQTANIVFPLAVWLAAWSAMLVRPLSATATPPAP